MSWVLKKRQLHTLLVVGQQSFPAEWLTVGNYLDYYQKRHKEFRILIREVKGPEGIASNWALSNNIPAVVAGKKSLTSLFSKADGCMVFPGEDFKAGMELAAAMNVPYVWLGSGKEPFPYRK